MPVMMSPPGVMPWIVAIPLGFGLRVKGMGFTA
jgi:hypothetical protein